MRTYAMGLEGPQVPVIGQGTWLMERDADPVAALRLGLDLGMTHIDTAEMYGRGGVEEIVGRAIGGRREQIYLVSKVLPENARRKDAIRACERSLRHLGTDYLDLYLLHAPSRYPFDETVTAFDELQAEGKIRQFGVSNFDAGDLRRAVETAGPGRIVCDQVVYHLLEREIEHEVLPECERLGVSLVGYSPLGQGNFPARDPTLQRVAAARGATAQQVALAFLIRRPGVFTIPKSGRLDHVRENAAAADLALTDEEIGRIDETFPAGRGFGFPVL